MAPPTRRSQARSATPAMQPVELPNEEAKPVVEQLLMNTYQEERFKFSFQEQELTAFECAQKWESFKTMEALLSTIPIEEIPQFLTRVLQGQPGRPLKCFSCERMYASVNGAWNHFKKCSISNQNSAQTAAQEFKIMPHLWLKVEKKNQKEMLKNIVGTDYTCFSSTCGKDFKTADALILHLDGCITHAYLSYMNRPDEFRKLDQKTKQKHAREAIKDLDQVKCLVRGCNQQYTSGYALVYHVDRCGLEKSAQPWKCYRCGYMGTGAESESHLTECAREAEIKAELEIEVKVESLLSGLTDTNSTPEPSTSSSAKRRRVAGGTPRMTARKDGTTLLRFRKSTVNREFNGIVTKKDQKSYEETCLSVYETWKTDSDEISFCDRLKNIKKSTWTPSKLNENDHFYHLFHRKSVTVRTEKADALLETLPSGVRIDALKTVDLGPTVAFCGAPINGIKVAPGKTSEEEDVVCVTTFANETDLESMKSVVQFWIHGENLSLWFLLEVPGTILSMRWLQKHDTKEQGLIGYVAFSTHLGKVFIYRIDESCAPRATDTLSVVKTEPHLTLSLPKSSENSEESLLNATIKVEGEEVVMPMRIDESSVPILKFAWTGSGALLAGITALGSIAVWNLEDDDDGLENPRLYIGPDWQSPPTDISFLTPDHLVVGFKEKIVKVMNIDTWEVKLEEGTVKTAGSKVHTDPRIVDSFFTFQSEYNSFPYSNATSISYIHMDIDSMNLILIPTGNTHQLMIWDVAMCAPLGTLLSSGIDGRLVASASGRLLRNINHPFFANRSIMSLKRRRLHKEVQTMEDFLKQPKVEDEEPSTSSTLQNSQEPKPPLEESLIEHDEICQKMWLEIGFDKLFEPTRVELSCRDQRIESLNCVDANTDRENPVAFTGGEAGLLFAISCKLLLKEMKL